MKKVVYYNQLFDAYKKLLKEEEQQIFADYYEEDLSMQEIADNITISKSAVGKKIKNIEQKLDTYEQKLKIVEKNQILENLLEEKDLDKIKEKISILLTK